MAIVKNVAIPDVTRNVTSSNPLLDLAVDDALIEPIAVIDVDGNVEKARRKVQSRAAYVTKHRGFRFAIRVIHHPMEGVDVDLPAIGVWRIA